MDDKRYSLNDIFSILRECTIVCSHKIVTVVADTNNDGTPSGEHVNMTLQDFIIMTVADELTNERSRFASDTVTVPKELIREVLENVGCIEAYPVYENYCVKLR